MANNIKRVRTGLTVDGDLSVGGTLNGLDLDVIAASAPSNYVKAGRVRNVTGSELPAFLVPDGVALQAVLEADSTAFEAVVDGISVSVNADITKAGLTAAPSTNNTALINDSSAADQADTRMWGEWNHRKTITIDNAGSEITALVGKWAAFQIAGVGTEYMLAFVKSSTELTNCIRGYFYDSSISPVKPTAFSDNDVLTLMRLSYIFINQAGNALDVTYRNPVWSATEPAAPSTGDFWFDTINQTWKKYNGSAFVAANQTLVGLTVQSASACVAARCEDFYAEHSDINTILLEKASNTQVRAEEPRAQVAVAGALIDFGMDRPVWDITADLAPAADMYSASEQASTLYWLYVKKNGDVAISDISPIRRGDLKGRYHRYNVWRCVGWMFNDGSSNIQAAANWNKDNGRIALSSGNGFGSTYTQTRRWTTITANSLSAIQYADSVANGGTFTVLVDGEVDAWGTDHHSSAISEFGWVFNADAVASDPSDRALDTRNSYTYAPIGNPQATNSYAICKIGDVIRFNTSGAFPTDQTNNVDANLKFLPGKE